MSIDYKSIGKRIKTARIRLDMTQERLAEQVNLSPSHLSNIETGTTKVSLPTIIKLANALQVSVDSLLADSVVQSKAVFEEDIQTILSDCGRLRDPGHCRYCGGYEKDAPKRSKIEEIMEKAGMIPLRRDIPGSISMISPSSMICS